MHYEANETNWSEGDIVLHDFDAKARFMLMVVTEIKKDGMIGTRYVYPGLIWDRHVDVPFGLMPGHARKHYGQLWLNEKKYLHDPARFNVEIPEQVIRYWDRG